MTEGTNTPVPRVKPWVMLHMAHQTPGTPMPHFIVGILEQELPGSYVLSRVLEQEPDDAHPRGYIFVESTRMDYINRTYVYRLTVLGNHKPDMNLYDAVEGQVELDAPPSYGPELRGIGE